MSEKLSKAEQALMRSMARLTNIRAEDRDKRRKEDAKRKILLGSGLEVMMQRDPTLRERVKTFMKEFLVRPRDIDVFGMRDATTYFESLDSAEFSAPGQPGTSATATSKRRNRGATTRAVDVEAKHLPKDPTAMTSRVVPSA